MASYRLDLMTHGSSPHTRGAPRPLSPLPLGSRIIPAYAGSTADGRQEASEFRDHPRIRGEHGVNGCEECLRPGSSPHTRGARNRQHRRIGARRDHPRIRGEHSSSAWPTSRPGGSSPHTRGAPGIPKIVPQWPRIIPAYAGSTRERDGGLMAAEDHPRIRGEHSTRRSIHRRRCGSSPHTRGARRCPRRCRWPPGIIPAYAGSTAHGFQVRERWRDHPRIRGEHCAHSSSK